MNTAIAAALMVFAMSGLVAAQAGPAASPGERSGEPPLEGPVGTTRVLKWKDGKKAAFFLAFDDSCPTHLKLVIPELKKRGMGGTFYVIAGSGLFKDQKDWVQAAKEPRIELGNHTWLHKAITSVIQFDEEVARANEAINQYVPGRKQPRLISFGQPGGVEWKITQQEKQEVLAKHHLIERPSFFGPPIHLKTAAEITKHIDTTIAGGEAGHLDFHGVGGDWLTTPMEQFTALLDKLESCRDELWITDAISCHKYAAERKSAEIKIVQADGKEVHIALSSQADPGLYDMSLTLQSKVPAEWKKCLVSQGPAQVTATVVDGRVQYEATPGSSPIVLQAAD